MGTPKEQQGVVGGRKISHWTLGKGEIKEQKSRFLDFHEGEELESSGLNGGIWENLR